MATPTCPITGHTVSCSVTGTCPVKSPCPTTCTCTTHPATCAWTTLCTVGDYLKDVVGWKAKTPSQPGVYRIVTPVPGMPLTFGPPKTAPNPLNDPCYLQHKYDTQKTLMCPDDAKVLYIGKAVNLQNRIDRYMRKSKSHSGGCVLWQIDPPEADQLLIQYCVCNDPASTETLLLQAFWDRKYARCVAAGITIPGKPFYYPLANRQL